MSYRRNRFVMMLFAYNPLIGAVVLILFGSFMTYGSIQGGMQDARFARGPLVVGTVDELKADLSPPPEYGMSAYWLDRNDNPWSGTIELREDQFVQLSEGDEVELRLAEDDPRKAVLASDIKGNEPVTILGISVHPLGFFGLALVLMGVAWGPISLTLRKEFEAGRM